MTDTENKVYARRCESHVEALRRAVPGCIEKVEWQCEDQLTITVKLDRGRPLPVPRALRLDSRDRRQRRAQPVRPLRRVLPHLHGGGGPRLGDRARRGRPLQDDVPVRDAVRSRLRVGRARAARYVRPDPRGPARSPSPGTARRLAERPVPAAQGLHGLPFPSRSRERHGKLRVSCRHQGQGDDPCPHGTAAHYLRRARPLPPVR